ncbi:MAG: 2-hydroxyacid dehydrogenase [bacterium]
MAYKVCITDQIPSICKNILTENKIEVVEWSMPTPPSFQELVEFTANCDGIVSMLGNKIDSNFLSSCPQLKVISNYAVGFNNIDITEATRRNIAVGNLPGTLTETTAELALALILAVSRKIVQGHKDVEQGKWERWLPSGYLGRDLQGKTLGIVGMGAIGQALAKKCHHGFKMNIIYCSRTPKPQVEQELKATKVEFQELLKRSEIISVHTPLTPETTAMFNYQAFEQMQQRPIFINTARGQVHDENALTTALDQGMIWGAGLDVTNPEPISSESPLLHMENVVITPHIGSATDTTRERMAKMAAENILAGLNRKELPGFVNPEVYNA